MNAPMKFSISAQVLLQQLDDEIVLLDISSGRYFGLPDVGARAWQCLTESGDSEQVVAILLGEYQVDEPTLRADLDELFGSLQAAGLIHAVAD